MENKKHIGFKINHLSRLLRQDLNNHAAALDLTASQSFLLGYLVHHQGQTIYQKDLERQFNFTHATASGTLHRLEAKGFVTFAPGENDRRCKQILPTEKAIACHEETLRHLQEAERRVTAGMTVADIQELHRLLDIAMKNVEEHTGAACRCDKEECT